MRTNVLAKRTGWDLKSYARLPLVSTRRGGGEEANGRKNEERLENRSQI